MSDRPPKPYRNLLPTNRPSSIIPMRKCLPNPITRQLDVFCFLMGEGVYYEYYKRSSCWNCDFYDSYICSTEQTCWLKEHNKEYFTILSNSNTDALCSSKDISPQKYAREIRYNFYKEYTSFYKLSWTRRKENPLPNCLTSMVRLLIRAPAANVLDWIESPMMYVVQNTSTGFVLSLTNEVSCNNMDIQKKQKTDNFIQLA